MLLTKAANSNEETLINAAASPALSGPTSRMNKRQNKRDVREKMSHFKNNDKKKKTSMETRNFSFHVRHVFDFRNGEGKKKKKHLLTQSVPTRPTRREAPSAAAPPGPDAAELRAPIEPPRYHRARLTASECECQPLGGVPPPHLPSPKQPRSDDPGVEEGRKREEKEMTMVKKKKKKKRDEQRSSAASLELMTDEHELQQTVH